MIRTNPELAAYIHKLWSSRDYSIQEMDFNAKTIIFEQDKRYGKVYVIREGMAKCYISDENGKDFIQEFLGPGMEFGELEVFDNLTTICSVEAIQNLKTFTMSHQTYQQLLATDSQFNTLVIKALANKIRYKAPRHSYQHSYPIEDNLLRLKKQFPEFTEVIPKKDIANYIGITPRSLNRALRELKDKHNGF
nr:Crp/Fnr family transcriptional regulator [Allomuricauda sp.]